MDPNDDFEFEILGNGEELEVPEYETVCESNKISKKQKPRAVYHCNICGSTCNNSSNYKAHLRIHTGEKPYVCKVCNAAFIQKTNLKVHVRTHSGERPYRCEICNMCFKRSSHLSGHKKTHTGMRPYSCTVCNETFATNTNLKNHQKKHIKNLTCKKCLRVFPSQEEFQHHQLYHIHLAKQNYYCHDCTSCFPTLEELTQHKKSHVNVKPFICGYCIKLFKTFANLLKHLERCAAPELRPSVLFKNGLFSGEDEEDSSIINTNCENGVDRNTSLSTTIVSLHQSTSEINSSSDNVVFVTSQDNVFPATSTDPFAQLSTIGQSCHIETSTLDFIDSNAIQIHLPDLDNC